ncbi:MAG: N-acetyltransferase family protein [Chloroflexota bacterium]
MDKHAEARFHIRAGRPEDASDIASLHVRAWQAAYAGRRLSRWPSYDERMEMWSAPLRDAAGPNSVWVAGRLDDDRPMGFALTGSCRDPDVTPGAGEIFALYVEPELTGRGIGGALLRHAVDDLLARGHTPLLVWTLEVNERARAFYERTGWRRDDARKLDGEETVVRYRLSDKGRDTAQ